MPAVSALHPVWLVCTHSCKQMTSAETSPQAMVEVRRFWSEGFQHEGSALQLTSCEVFVPKAGFHPLCQRQGFTHWPHVFGTLLHTFVRSKKTLQYDTVTMVCWECPSKIIKYNTIQKTLSVSPCWRFFSFRSASIARTCLPDPTCFFTELFFWLRQSWHTRQNNWPSLRINEALVWKFVNAIHDAINTEHQQIEFSIEIRESSREALNQSKLGLCSTEKCPQRENTFRMLRACSSTPCRSTRRTTSRSTHTCACSY